MKLQKHILTVTLALAGAALLHTSASAATGNDLILGFQITDNTNANFNTDLEVDLGQASTFTSLEGTGTVVNLNVGGALGTGGLSAADLSGTYGSNWNSISSLQWSVGGSSGLPNKEVWITQDPTATAPSFGSNTTPSGALFAEYGALGGLTATSHSTSSFITSRLNSGTYSFEITNNGGSPSGNDYSTGLNLQQVVSSTGVESLELYDKTNGASGTVTEVGTFTLGSDGTFTFTATGSATPEPSAYALGLCAMLLFFVLKRRSALRA